MAAAANAEHRLAGPVFEPVEPRLQQRQIAAKAVDHESGDARLLALAQQCQRPHHVGEHATTVDIGDQDHRAIHRLGKPHVGDIALTQVDLGG